MPPKYKYRLSYVSRQIFSTSTAANTLQKKEKQTRKLEEQERIMQTLGRKLIDMKEEENTELRVT